MKYLPKLYRNHPNFFFIYFATAMYHLGTAIFHFVQPERFEAPSLAALYETVPLHIWGLISLYVWVMMTLGAYSNFLYGRFGLVVGMATAVYRGIALEIGEEPAGGSMLVFLLIAALHYVQTAEPQVNPTTAKG